MPELATRSFTTAITEQYSDPVTGLGSLDGLSLVFTANLVAASGTNATAVVQTSLDEGDNWYDICNARFTATGVKLACVNGTTSHAPADAATLSANSKLDGFLGDRLRVRFDSTGTWGTGSSLSVDYQPRSRGTV
jgi:hypothetical protein